MSHRTISLVAICLSLVLSPARSAECTEPPSVPRDFAGVESYVAAAMQRHNIPGMALAITQGGQVVFSKGYGTAGHGRSVTPDTPFYIGSQSKSFTALAVIQLVEQGSLELDAPVQTYLPWFRVADPQASARSRSVICCSIPAGFPNRATPQTFRRSPHSPCWSMICPCTSHCACGHPNAVLQSGLQTLGLIVETVSGQSYGDFIDEHIFAPLKMTHSFADPAAADAAGLSQGYSQIFMLAVPHRQTFYASDLPAGFIMSTANDMARYLMALGNGGALDGVRILETENVALIFTPNTSLNNTYGFGWYISEYYGEAQITHGGDTERFHTSVLLLPERGLSLVVLYNENHLLKDFGEYNAMLWSIASLLTGAPMPAERPSSIVYGWGLFTLWVVLLVSAGRKLSLLPQWRAKMLTWTPRRRRLELLKHLLGIAVTLVIATMIGPAFLDRGFNLRWFVAFLPDVAILVATLVLDDGIQLILKLWMITQH